MPMGLASWRSKDPLRRGKQLLTWHEATDAACCRDVEIRKQVQLIQRAKFSLHLKSDTSAAHSSYNPCHGRGNKGDTNNSAYVISAPAVFAPWPTFL